MRLILVLFLFLSPFVNAQNIVEDSVYFEYTQSYRKIKIWLPDNYDAQQTYLPVFCFDASLLFNVTWSNVEILSDVDVGKMPPSIVIGIYFEDRNKDMDINWENGLLNEQGMAFKTFMTDSIIPKIERKFSVSNYRTIVGHSNSSTYAQNFIIDEEPVFNGVITMSQFYINELFSSIAHTKKSPIDFVFTSADLDADFRYESGFKLDSVLRESVTEGLNYEHILIEGGDHITMVNRGLPLALEKLFQFYSAILTLPDTLQTQLSPKGYVDSLIQLRNEKYGIQMSYGWNELNLLYDVQVLLKDSLNIGVSTRLYQELFPEYNLDAYFLEAQILEQMGAYHLAEKSYLKNMEVNKDAGVWSYRRLIWLYAYRLSDPYSAIHWSWQAYGVLADDIFLQELIDIGLKYPNYQAKIIKGFKLEIKDKAKRSIYLEQFEERD